MVAAVVWVSLVLALVMVALPPGYRLALGLTVLSTSSPTSGALLLSMADQNPILYVTLGVLQQILALLLALLAVVLTIAMGADLDPD